MNKANRSTRQNRYSLAIAAAGAITLLPAAGSAQSCGLGDDFALVSPDGFNIWNLDTNSDCQFELFAQHGLPSDRFYMKGEPIDGFAPNGTPFRNGRDDLVIARDINGDGLLEWFVRINDLNPGFSGYMFQSRLSNRDLGIPGFGRSIDIPVIGKWGGGFDQAAVKQGDYFIIDSNRNLNYDVGVDQVYNWPVSINPDEPANERLLSGEFGGNNFDDVAVWRSATRTWEFYYFYIGPAATPSATCQFGLPGDMPVIIDANGDGHSDIAVWRPSTNHLYVNYWRPGEGYISDHVDEDRAYCLPAGHAWNKGALGLNVDRVQNIRPQPPASVNVDRPSFCWYDPGVITLTAVGGSGAVVRWTTDACGGSLLPYTGASITIPSPSVSTRYFAHWENQSPCPDPSGCAWVDVEVVQAPVAPTDARVNRPPFCASDSGTITLTAEGGSGQTLVWYSGTCGGQPLGTGTSLTIPSPTASSTYFARWENACGVSGCASVDVPVVPLPQTPNRINASQTTACAGDHGMIHFDVVGGSGTTVRWFQGACNGVELGTGTSIDLPIPPQTTTYFARYENAADCASTCASVTFNVTQAPQPPTAAQASSNNFCTDTGGTITLRAVGGSGTVARWFANDCSGAPVGTGDTITIPAPTQTTTYCVRWENGSCVSACACVAVNVLQLPAPPASAMVDRSGFCADDPGNIALSAQAPSGITLEWFEGTCAGPVWRTGSLIVIPSPTTSTTYYVRARNSCGVSACQPVPVSVSTSVGPSISSHPASGPFTEGESVSLSVSASGTGPLSYQWRRNGVALQDNGHFIGTHTASMTLVGTSTYDVACYDVVVTNTCSQVASHLACLTLACTPVIATEPPDADPVVGDSIEICVNAVGTGTLTYQWYKDNTPLSGGRFGGTTTPCLTINNVRLADTGDYLVRVTNACGTTDSNPAHIHVYCPADFNRDHRVDSRDFFDFLECFLSGCTAADLNHDAFIDSQDFFLFLTRFLAGC